MGVIATALRHLISAGVTGDALVTAIADIEAEQMSGKLISERSSRQERNARYYAKKASEKRLNASYSDYSDAEQKRKSPTPPIEKTTSSLRSDISFEREHAEFLDQAWKAIPKRHGDSPKPFRKAMVGAIRKGADIDAIRRGIAAYAAAQVHADPQFRKGAAVWVNAAGWEADYSQQPPARAGPAQRGGVGAMMAKLYGARRNGRESGNNSEPIRELSFDGEPSRNPSGGDAEKLHGNPALSVIAGSFKRM